MNTPAPSFNLDPPNPNTPSPAIIVGAAIGTPVATIIGWILQLNKIVAPPEVIAAMGAVIAFGIAYFAPGGKAAHLKGN